MNFKFDKYYNYVEKKNSLLIIIPEFILINKKERINNVVTSILDWTSYLNKYGIKTEIMCENDLHYKNVDLLGITFTSPIREDLIKKVRKIWKNIPIFLGGLSAVISNDDYRKRLNKKYDVFFCDSLAEIFFTEHNKIDWENYPSWITNDFYYLKNCSPKNSSQWYFVQFQRGCPFDCSFCNNLHRKINYYNVQSFCNNLELLKNESLIYFSDELVGINQEKYLELIKEFEKRQIIYKNRFFMFANSRVPRIELLSKFNPRIINIGVESANLDILKNMNKVQDLQFQKEYINELSKICSYLHVNLVVNYNGETLNSFRETIDYCNELKGDNIFIKIHNYLPNSFKNYKQILSTKQINNELLKLNKKFDFINYNKKFFKNKKLM